MTDAILIQRDGPVAEIVLNRPDKRNALSLAMFDALSEAGRAIGADPAIRAVILRAEGPDFCSGIDTAVFTANPDPAALIARLHEVPEGETANPFQKPCTVWQEIDVPVIAALSGAVFGAGLQLALGADIRLAAPNARLSVMEITWGLIPDMGIATTLPRLVRADIAKELLFTGRTVAADEAARIGLVTRLADDPLAEARALAQQIAGRNPDAIRRDKRLMNDAWLASRAEALRLEAALQAEVIGRPNQVEAIMARVQKREPRFR